MATPICHILRIQTALHTSVFVFSFTLLSLSLFLAGYFTQISTLADVQENVMEYLHVLSRPKVIDREHDTVWTEAYIDNTVSGLSLHGARLKFTKSLLTLRTHFIDFFYESVMD